MSSHPPNPTHSLFPHHLASDSDSDDDDDDDEEDIVPDPDSNSNSNSDSDPHHVSLPQPTLTPLPPPPPPPPTLTLTVALPTTTPPPLQKPIDDSRRLFQRLWTDEDEIELLQGFLDYTASRGGHHHDTTAFYEQIKNKLQLEFNKNQLVEKLRRLKKKYRNVLAKITSGKDFLFKSNHDQATFQLSRQIWRNLSANYRGTGGGSVVEFDEDDKIPNPNPSHGYNAVTVATPTPPRPLNSSYVISHINLNSATSGGFDTALVNSSELGKLSTRKRPRGGGKVEEKVVKVDSGNNNHNNNNNLVSSNYLNNVSVSSPLQGLVEETVRNCLSPVLNNLINTATNGATIASPRFTGVGTLAINAVPLNFSGVKVECGMNEKWRKQQILELEVYSKRLQLVQDQIKLSLEELKSMES